MPLPVRPGRTRILWLLVAVCTAALLQGCAHLAPEGGNATSFRGVRWGAGLQDLGGMEVVEEAGDFSRAVRKGEDLRFGGARLEQVTYQFEKGLFFAGTLKFSGEASFLAVKEELERRYGPPAIAHTQANVFSWPGEKVSVSLRYYRMSGTGEATWTYLPLARSAEGA